MNMITVIMQINANVTVFVKKDENGVEKYFKYSEIVCERIGHPVVVMILNVKVCYVFTQCICSLSFAETPIKMTIFN